jgi:predicted nucleic acid-binding Zn ribbon protein
VLSGLKCNDPLRTVTILVPNQKFGVAVRRFLARGIDGRAGVAGLSVLTVDRLAEQVATPTLVGSGRRPATDAVIAAAWRRALDEEPGSFALVATHPATVRALAAAHRELQEIDDAAHDAIAQCGNPVTADLVRLHRRVVQVLAGSWYDVTDLRRGNDGGKGGDRAHRRVPATGPAERRNGLAPAAGDRRRSRSDCGADR